MKHVPTFVILLLLCIFITFGMMWGCGEEDDACPTCPNGSGPTPTLTNIWPNEDGTFWKYYYTRRFWSGDTTKYYDEEDDVPPAPTLSEVAAILGSHPVGDSIQSIDNLYELEFDSLITAHPGHTVQNLKETISTISTNNARTNHLNGRDAFLVKLLIARPDLKEKIIPRLENTGAIRDRIKKSVLEGKNGDLLIDVFLLAVLGPLYLHGGEWEKTSEWIGTYGDIDQSLAWKYLTQDLSVGSEFSFQLVPDLASNVYLHCRILRYLDFQHGLETYKNAIECLYMVDYGVSLKTDVYGNILGYNRVIDYGTIIYVPDVGPVYSYERNIIQSLDPLSAGLGDVSVILLNTGRISD